MEENRLSDDLEPDPETLIALAIKEHGAVAPMLDFFAFLAPTGIPAHCLVACKTFLPSPLRELSDSEFAKLFEVLDSHNLVVRSASEICILVEVQEHVRSTLDVAMSVQVVRAGVRFLYSIASEKRIGQLDGINHMAWHTAVLARWAAKMGLRDMLNPLLKLLDMEGRVLIAIWPDRAILCHQQAIELCKALQGDEHPGVAIRINNLAEAWHRLGEHARADDYFQQALQLLKNKMGNSHQFVANLMGNLALLRRDQKQLDDSEEYFKRALRIVESKHGLENHLTNLCVNGLGRIIKAKDGAEAAVEFLSAALQKSIAVSGVKNHPNIAAVYNNLGLLHLEIGDNGLARQNLESALEVARETMPTSHPRFGQILANIKLLEN